MFVKKMAQIDFKRALIVSESARKKEKEDREKRAKKILRELKFDGSKKINEYSKKDQKKIVENLPHSGDYLLDLINNKPKK